MVTSQTWASGIECRTRIFASLTGSTMELPEALRERCRSLLGKDSAEYYPHTLETQFPRIFANIVDNWGTPRLDAYFSELLLTSRSGRQGFPVAVAEEIMHLHRLYHERGLASPGSPSPATGWDWIYRQEAGPLAH